MFTWWLRFGDSRHVSFLSVEARASTAFGGVVSRREHASVIINSTTVATLDGGLNLRIPPVPTRKIEHTGPCKCSNA